MSTHDHEQRKNAEILVQAGFGRILPQSHLSLSSFLQSVSDLKLVRAKSIALPRNASSVIADQLGAALG
jgi:UDP-N-acetylglucosamine:LPS N-acetylglucosamine transferase